MADGNCFSAPVFGEWGAGGFWGGGEVHAPVTADTLPAVYREMRGKKGQKQ